LQIFAQVQSFASANIVQFLGFGVLRVLITHKHGTIENYVVAKKLRK
jgi:hypothetical protein